jgi:siroheme decarboxylase
MDMRVHDLAWLADCQQHFPLVARPYAAVAGLWGLSEPDLLQRLRALREQGTLSRIGAVWASGAGGAAALCALAVPPAQLERAAALVSSHPGVNHNYEREHAWNLWFVLTGGDTAAVRGGAERLARQCGAPLLFLPRQRTYRLDLAFDPEATHAPAAGAVPAPRGGPPVAPAEQPLAALAEQGLALVERPFDRWAAQLGWPRAAVLAALQRWQASGTLRRFGAVLRHHELGFRANAMTVLQAPPGQADALGAALAAQPGVTLVCRRATAPHWPYDLYFMVHARERGQAEALIAQALQASGADRLPHASLFTRRRFKQTGGSYFRHARPHRAPTHRGPA